MRGRPDAEQRSDSHLHDAAKCVITASTCFTLTAPGRLDLIHNRRAGLIQAVRGALGQGREARAQVPGVAVVQERTAVYVLVRPRGGDCMYSNTERQVLLGPSLALPPSCVTKTQ